MFGDLYGIAWGFDSVKYLGMFLELVPDSTVMSTYSVAIGEILKFKRVFDGIDPDARIPHKLVGQLGEYYVLREFEEIGVHGIEHRGGHSGCDVYLRDINKRIEVRTSLLKNEGLYPNGIQFFGWKVMTRRQKTDKKFDFLVGVALTDSFKRPKFYIFSHKEAFSVEDVELGRFGNIQKKIHLFENLKAMEQAVKAKPKYVTKYEKYINRNQHKFLNKWGKITGARRSLD